MLDGTTHAPAVSTSRTTSRSLVTTTSTRPGGSACDEPTDEVVGDLPDGEQDADAARVAAGRVLLALLTVEAARHLGAGAGGDHGEPVDEPATLVGQGQLPEPGLRDVVAVDHQVRPRLAQQLVEQQPGRRPSARATRVAPRRGSRRRADEVGGQVRDRRQRELGTQPARGVDDGVEQQSDARRRRACGRRAARRARRCARPGRTRRSSSAWRRSSSARDRASLGGVERRTRLLGRTPCPRCAHGPRRTAAGAARAAARRAAPGRLAPPPVRPAASRPEPFRLGLRPVEPGLHLRGAGHGSSSSGGSRSRQPGVPRSQAPTAACTDGGTVVGRVRRRPGRRAPGSSAPRPGPPARGRRRPAGLPTAAPHPRVARRRGANRCTARSDAGTSTGSVAPTTSAATCTSAERSAAGTSVGVVAGPAPHRPCPAP